MQMASVDRTFTLYDPFGDGDDFEINITGYRSATEATRDEPGEGGEVELGSVVNRLTNGRKAEELPFERLVAMMAEDSGSLESVERDLHEEAYLWLSETLADEADDYDPGDDR